MRRDVGDAGRTGRAEAGAAVTPEQWTSHLKQAAERLNLTPAADDTTELQARINAALELHRPDTTRLADPPLCYECADNHPCSTRRTLEGNQ